MCSKWLSWFWLLSFGASLSGCDGLRAWIVRVYPQNYDASGEAKAASIQGWPPGIPAFDGPDAGLEQMEVVLTPVARGFAEPTDIQFVPGSSTVAVVLEKAGKAIRLDLETDAKTTLLQIEVPTKSEQGLLGWAFHPDWTSNGRVFLNHTARDDQGTYSRVSEWHVDPETFSAQRKSTILEVVQPYANHNAGQLAFGPDRMLYIGWGDGGWRDDPHLHGQNSNTWLGAMLRIDVDRTEGDRRYAIPPDNPFVGTDAGADEVWATGLRNPWRYSFMPDGRLVVADVGQDAWEEVTIVAAGDNHGWNVREARHCFSPSTGCDSTGMTDPVYEYDHESGESITGGYVYTGSRLSALKGKYVFADFVSSRFWAIDLPAKGQEGIGGGLRALGRWPILPSTFGQAANGELYVAGFSNGMIFRIDPR